MRKSSIINDEIAASASARGWRSGCGGKIGVGGACFGGGANGIGNGATTWHYRVTSARMA